MDNQLMDSDVEVLAIAEEYVSRCRGFLPKGIGDFVNRLPLSQRVIWFKENINQHIPEHIIDKPKLPEGITYAKLEKLDIRWKEYVERKKNSGNY